MVKFNMFGILENVPDLPEYYDGMSHMYHHRVEDSFTKKFGTGIENIKVIRQGVPKNLVDDCLSFMSSFSIRDNVTKWYSLFSHPEYMAGTNIDSFISVRDILVSLAEKAYGEKLILDNPFFPMVHPTGTSISSHTDVVDSTITSKPDINEQIKKYKNLWTGHLSILTYLNNDYEGGYLYFPDFDYYLKPDPGDVVMFPGSLHYVHGVSKITSGVRYAISQWAKFEFYDD